MTTIPTPDPVPPGTISKWFVLLVITYLVATTGVVWQMLTGRLAAVEAAQQTFSSDVPALRSDVRDLRTRMDLLLEKQGIPQPK